MITRMVIPLRMLTGRILILLHSGFVFMLVLFVFRLNYDAKICYENKKGEPFKILRFSTIFILLDLFIAWYETAGCNTTFFEDSNVVNDRSHCFDYFHIRVKHSHLKIYDIIRIIRSIADILEVI